MRTLNNSITAAFLKDGSCCPATSGSGLQHLLRWGSHWGYSQNASPAEQLHVGVHKVVWFQEEQKATAVSSICLSLCLSPWRHTHNPEDAKYSEDIQRIFYYSAQWSLSFLKCLPQNPREKNTKKTQAIRKSNLKTHFPIILFCFSLKRPLLMNRAARGALSWEAEQKEEWKHILKGFIFKWHLLNHKNALTTLKQQLLVLFWNVSQYTESIC